MADLLTLNAVKKVQRAIGTDSRREGFPLFNQWGGQGNQDWQCKNYDSSFQPVGGPWAAVTNSTSSYRMGMLGDPTFAYSRADFGTANGQLTSQGYNTWDNWQQSLHQNDQYPASAFGSVAAQGYQTFYSLHNTTSTKLYKGYVLINQIMPEGMRPRRFFGMYDNSFMEFAGLTQMNQNIDLVDLSTYSTARTKTEGRGSAGYNEKTQTLVTIHSNATSSWTITKYVSTVNLNLCDNLKDFFDTATVTEFEHTASAYNSQSRYDKVVVVGDNNWIGVSYRYGNNFNSEVIDISGNNETTIILTSISGTTSYGIDQGVMYYSKMNLTWDGKWAAAYQPYYYYGGGLSSYIFSTEDPRRNFRINNTNSSGGGALFPIGKSGFVYFNGQNTDSTDVYMIAWDFKNTDKVNYLDNTTYAHSNTSFTTAVPTIINGSVLNSSVTTTKSGLTGNSYTTSYPRFMTVNYWPLNGKQNYEGGK